MGEPERSGGAGATDRDLRRRRGAVLGVVGVLGLLAVTVLAGCSGLQPATDPGTPTAGAVPADPPPGVDRLGVHDPRSLASSHARALENASSYTFRRRYVERYANGSLRVRVTDTVQHDRRAGTFWYVQTLDGDGGQVTGRTTTRYEQWSNGSVTTELVEVTGQDPTSRVLTTTDGGWIASEEPRATDVRRTQEIYSLLIVSNGTSVRRVDGGYRVEAFDVNPRTAVSFAPLFGVGRAGVDHPGVTGVRSVSFVALVRPDGLVLSYELQYVVTSGGEPVRATHRVDYTALGTTSVPRPDWATDAIDGWAERQPHGNATG